MKTPQKILFLITKSNWGGAQRYVFDLACEAKTHGYEPIVGCGGNGILTSKLHERNIRTTSITAFQRDINLVKELQSFFDVFRIIKAERPDLIHVNSSKAGGIGALAARLQSSACIVFTVHGLPQREKRSFLSRTMIAFATWLTAILSHRVITVTKADAEILQKQPFLKKKVHHIQLGIEHAALPTTEARARIRDHLDQKDREKLSGDNLWIGTVAELTANKGHRYALEAFSALVRTHPDARYILIGSGELENELRLDVEKRGLQDKVIFAGFVPDAASLYAAFDMYVASSVKEGLPYTILEALMTGIPVIATRAGGIPEVIAHGVSGHLVASESSAELATSMAQLAENEPYRTTLANNAQAEAGRLHTKAVMANETFTLYQECTQPKDA